LAEVGAAAGSNDEPDILIETMDTTSNPDEKKRSYEAAFDDEEEKSVSASAELANRKKIRPSESIEGLASGGGDADKNSINVDTGTGADHDESDSINDASDALSDEEASGAAVTDKVVEVATSSNKEAVAASAAAIVHPTTPMRSTRTAVSSKFGKRSNDVIEEEDELLEEDEDDADINELEEEELIDNDCIIEENSNDVRNEELAVTYIVETNTADTFGSVIDYSHNVGNNNCAGSSNDRLAEENANEDDVIECTSSDEGANAKENVDEYVDDNGSEVIEINGEDEEAESRNYQESGTNSLNGVGGLNEGSTSNYDNCQSASKATTNGSSGDHVNGSNGQMEETSEDGVTVIE
jgi:hypothetical protein